MEEQLVVRLVPAKDREVELAVVPALWTSVTAAYPYL